MDADQRPNAVRLALTHEPGLDRVSAGLRILRDLLEECGTSGELVL